MDWVSDAVSKRQFEGFAAGVSDSLLRTGYLMTGDVRGAEDLVQETFLRVARRWNRVRSMDHPAAYARRNLDQSRPGRHQMVPFMMAGCLRPVIPAGYTRAGRIQVTGPPPKTLKR